MKKLKSIIADFPFWLDSKFRWWDLQCQRSDLEGLRKRWKLGDGYSWIPVVMPLPIIAFLFYGPLIFDHWRGILPAIGFAVTVLIHFASCRIVTGGNRLAQAQWAILSGTSLLLFAFAPKTAHQADSALYPHLLMLFVPVVLTLGLPFNRWWANRLFDSKRGDYRDSFQKNLNDTQLFVKPERPPNEYSRYLHAFFLALMLTPLMLAYPTALLTLFLDPRRFWLWHIATLLLSWVVLAAVHYNERLIALQSLLKKGFFSGGTSILSLMVIALAGARLAGVSYVTTVLDGATRWTVFALLACLYLTLWLYDYWSQRTLSEVLLGLLDDGDTYYPNKVEYNYQRNRAKRKEAIQIHGGGRFLAVSPFDPKRIPDKFQAYLPLELFRIISRQLTERARAHGKRDTWKIAITADHRLETLEQRVACYYALPTVLLLFLLGGTTFSVINMTQQPGLSMKQEQPTRELQLVDVYEQIKSRASDVEPVLAIAASGGGTRAALYTYSLLHEIQARDLLDRVVLLSGVSGGSASIAYYAAHRQSLSNDGIPWQQYRCAMAEPYIRDVLAGVGEKRFLDGVHLGQQLTESFDRRFLDGIFTESECKDGEKIEKEQATLGYIAKTSRLGLIFNMSVVGSFNEADPIQAKCLDIKGKIRDCATSATSGGRLALTNIAAMTEKNVSSMTDSWQIDMHYSIHHDPKIPLSAAASLSANFPPVFSNAAVDFTRHGKKNRYYVTDGGAVENRALISLLLALRASINNQTPAQTTLPPLKILVADASALSTKYREDRGVGAMSGAKSQIASKLIGELARDVDIAYRNLSGEIPAAGPDNRPGVEIVYLPMPEVLRVSSAFGTHWMMPGSIEISDPLQLYLKPKRWYRPFGSEEYTLKGDELLTTIDLLFAKDQDRIEAASSMNKNAMSNLFNWMGPDDPRIILDNALKR